jgi:hypothetical protein
MCRAVELPLAWPDMAERRRPQAANFCSEEKIDLARHKMRWRAVQHARFFDPLDPQRPSRPRKNSQPIGRDRSRSPIGGMRRRARGRDPAKEEARRSSIPSVRRLGPGADPKASAGGRGVGGAVGVAGVGWRRHLCGCAEDRTGAVTGSNTADRSGRSCGAGGTTRALGWGSARPWGGSPRAGSLLASRARS